MMESRVCVVMPAYNEEASIGLVLITLKKSSFVREIVVIDDGSTDRTAQVAKTFGVTLLSHHTNKGRDRSIETGLRYAVKKYDVVVMLDADGQHDPRDIPKLLQACLRGADMAIGNRYFARSSYRGSRVRRVGAAFLSTILYFFCAMRISDPSSGFRALNNRAVTNLLSHFPSEFFEPVSIARVLSQKLRVAEVSVTMQTRLAGRSYITPWYTARLMMVFLLELTRLAFLHR